MADRPVTPLLTDNADIFGALPDRRRLHDQPFLIGPDGRPDVRVNGFFASPGMRNRSVLTWRKYSESVAMWLNFLHVLGVSWDEATEDDAENFKEWRVTSPNNPDRVEGSTFATNLVALRMFYRWRRRCPSRRKCAASCTASPPTRPVRQRSVRRSCPRQPAHPRGATCARCPRRNAVYDQPCVSSSLSARPRAIGL